MKVREIKVKSVLTKSNLPGVDLVVNPYVGCHHACLYCYADFMKRFTGHQSENWGEFVDVKVNASETINLLKVPKDALILFGSVTDPYQCVESKYNVTRRCLEKLLEIQPNIEILTKSPLILRDIDLLKRFKNLRVGVSIGVLDEKSARELEPFVVSPKKRIEVLKKLHEAGIRTFLFVSPIFPGVSDVTSLLDLTHKYVEEVMFENLNVRANNRGRILGFVRKNKPELKELYKSLRDNVCWDKIEKDIVKGCEEKGVKYRVFF